MIDEQIARIARENGRSEHEVRSILRDLEAKGLVVKTGDDGFIRTVAGYRVLRELDARRGAVA